MKNTVTQKQIDSIWETAEKEVITVFNKCTIMAVRLADGFVLVESSACVDPVNYDEELGKSICETKLKNKLWELEGYKLQGSLKGV